MNFRKINVLFLSLFLTSVPLTRAAVKMNTPRHSQTTTLLPDGNILITGGVINAAGTSTTSVEMYNMATNQYETDWTNLAVHRSSHTATLMSDGRVLIAGGFSAGNPLESTEICNPVAKSCTLGPSMNSKRGGHTATLLDKGPNAGQVLLCGGQSGTDPKTITGTCDLFNPAGTGSIVPTGALKYPRMGHAATSLYSGKVFVTGGKVWDTAAFGGAAWLYQPATEIYDPLTGAWSDGAALLQGRTDHTVTVLNNGLIMIAGGYNAANVLTCKPGADILTDECWHKKGVLSGDASIIAQDAGSHGYLDGAEFFYQKGGSVVLGETSYGVAPYRNSKHSAALMPDGSWNMFGGYGGIVPTFFQYAPNLAKDSIIHTVNTGPNTASLVDTTSIIKFPLVYKLSRPVSGRLVNADTFISPPPTAGDSSIATDNVSILIGKSTAPLDGTPVGTLIGTDYLPGDFNYNAKLLNPAGTAVFKAGSIKSDGSLSDTVIKNSSFTLFYDVLPGEADKPLIGNTTTWIAFTLPDLYRGIHGIATLVSGTIADTAMTYSITLKEGGTATLNIPLPNSCDADKKTCVYITTAVITGVSGTINNLTTDTTFFAANTLDTSGAQVRLTMDFNYTADEIRFDNRDTPYNFDTSTTVIREMIYSTELGFSPKTATWKDLTNPSISPTLIAPTFDQTTLVTPAADTVVQGGRNCEDSPANDCRRDPLNNFTPISTSTVFVPVLRAPDGSGTWPNGPKLNSRRAFHTSTLLLTGQILTCGGSDGARTLATCELMNPLTKAWTPTGSMNYPRSLHTATLLPNGTVLVTGGVTTDGSTVKYSEIFYPDTQRWVLTSPMAQPRQMHTATLLPDGNVLVAGGDNSASAADHAELFISSNATWQTVSPMTMNRSQHTATLMKDGNVLITGGVGGAGGGLATTEIYRSATKDFVAGLPLSTPRYGHTANLLRDGRVLVIGGSDNVISGLTSEIFNGTNWATYLDPESKADLILVMKRTNHRSVLLPNGKVLVTGGKSAGVVQARAESYDPDFSNWSDQGGMTGRLGHTSVLTRDNFVINIGGWDGSKNLDTTDITYFSYYPDLEGLAADTTRQAVISSGTASFDHGNWATLLSSAANFHGVTEASGGGAGPRNSSYSNPRVYMNQIDNPSGFMIDLSTRIYSLYGGQNTVWANTLSSITIITPTLPGEMPYGWYTMRVAANGLFSEGITVQVTTPTPVGAPSIATAAVLGVSSIKWSWTRGTIPANGADGYNLYASSNNVFISTTAFGDYASYTQTGLRPNTEASLMVNSYNIGGTGPLSRSATYYTLAAPPLALAITGASFETADLAWGNNSNTAATPYELSMYACPIGDSLVTCSASPFSETLNISTPVPFNVNLTSTFTETNQLTPNRGYLFRVRAMNGEGKTTAFSNLASTMTVGNVNNLTGTAISSAAISWSWDKSSGADGYEIYDISAGTSSPVFISSTTYNYFAQTGLAANRSYSVAVLAIKNTPLIKGPPSGSSFIYTLAVEPAIMSNSFRAVLAESFTVNWMPNGNAPSTVYKVELSSSAVYPSSSTVTVSTTADKADFSGLSPNVRYYARVYSINGDGRPSAAADLGSKFTKANAPANVTPAVISMSGVTLTWSQNGNSPETIYEVRYTTETFDVSSTTIYGVTGDSYSFTGLLTSTIYNFQVAALNGEGYETAAIDAVPSARTKDGPSNAPSGSVGGTSDPSKNVIISGTLPTGRPVAMSIPAPTFPAATAIAISASTQDLCGYTVGGTPIEVAVYSMNSAQPQAPVTLTLNYTQPEAMAAIDTNRQNLVLARYKPMPGGGVCLPLETFIDTGLRTITATLNYFAMPGYNSSIFQLMMKTAATDLSNVVVYPNPFYVNRGNGFVTINNIPASSSVRIYTLSGAKVWEGKAGTTGLLIWKGQNKAGFLVASGIYLAVIDSSAGKKVLKLAVER